MKRALAAAMTLFLLGVVALCPVIACPLMAAHAESGSCCHKPQKTHPAPCPLKTVPDCPYSILEKSKTNPAATHAKWVGAAIQTATGSALPLAGLTVTAPCRLIDAAGLFLRNRALLI
jgi:hypothetical protein